MSGFLSKRLALIDDSSIDLANAPPKRKMGRQMASHGFRQALKYEGDGEPTIIKPSLPSHELRSPVQQWEALYMAIPPEPLRSRASLGRSSPLQLIGITHTLSTTSSVPARLTPGISAPLGCTHLTSAAAFPWKPWDHSDVLCRCRGGQPAHRPQLPLIPIGIKWISLHRAVAKMHDAN